MRQRCYPSDDFDALYEDLRKLFHLINGDRPAQNKACNVTRYNGGLFNPKQHPKIEDWRIGDKSLADVLRQLIFSQPPARASVRQQEITTEEAIDYSTLEVRQLGDIYEGLLGAVLREQTGRLVLVNQNGENHRHGIFYTPDWIVRYLLRESLQPLVDEICASREVEAALKAKSEEKRRDNSFAHAVLRLNLVDPAMGSGHFLVRATEWLAEQILYHPTTRLAGIITALVQDPPLTLIGIEEPELTVHVGAIPLLYDYLKQASRREQVLLTTHSIELLELLDVDDIRVVERRTGVTAVAGVRHDQRDAVKQRLMTVGEIISMEGGLQPELPLSESPSKLEH